MRFVMKIWRGDLRLPAKDVMYKEIENERRAKNCSNRHFHNKGVEGEHQYWVNLAEYAEVKGIPNVLNRIHAYVIKQKRNVKQAFRILNNEEFEIYEV